MHHVNRRRRHGPRPRAASRRPIKAGEVLLYAPAAAQLDGDRRGRPRRDTARGAGEGHASMAHHRCRASRTAPQVVMMPRAPRSAPPRAAGSGTARSCAAWALTWGRAGPTLGAELRRRERAAGQVGPSPARTALHAAEPRRGRAATDGAGGRRPESNCGPRLAAGRRRAHQLWPRVPRRRGRAPPLRWFPSTAPTEFVVFDEASDDAVLESLRKRLALTTA